MGDGGQERFGQRDSDESLPANTAWTRRRLLGLGAAAVAAGLGARGPALADTATPEHEGHGPATRPAWPVAGAQTIVDLAARDETLVRKNARDLTADEKRAFVESVLALKEKPSEWAPGISVYDTFVIWHRDAFDCGLMAAHMSPAFLPWHRVYLRLFELELQKVNPSVTVPYWDWTVDNQVNAYLWQDDFLSGSGNPDENFAVTTGPFAKDSWEIKVWDYDDTHRLPYIVRDVGASSLSPALPTPAEVEEALSIPNYDVAPWNSMSDPQASFRNYLEGWRGCTVEACDSVVGMVAKCNGPHPMHNGVHLWVAGEYTFAHQEPVANATPISDDSPVTRPIESETLMGTMAFNSSPNDPVFWLHHANVDRIWSRWMARHGDVYAPEEGAMVGQNLHDAMWPYHQIRIEATPAMTLNSRLIGYRYDTDEN